MLVEAIQASLLQEEAQAAAPPNGDGHSAAAATVAAPGLAAPAAQAPAREPVLAQAVGKAPGTAGSPGLGASPGAHPGAGRRSSGGLRGLFGLLGSARRSAAQEPRAPVSHAGQAESAGVAGGAAAAPGLAAPDLAAQPLPAEQNAAREMLHAPGERDAAGTEGPGTAANAQEISDAPASAEPRAGEVEPAAQGLEQGSDAPVAPGSAPGSGPGFELSDMRARAAAVRAARAWQPPGGVAELEAALPMARDPTEELPASGEPRPSDECRCAAEPRRSIGAVGQDSGDGAAPQARRDDEPLRGDESDGAAVAAAGANVDPACGAGGKGGRSVPILADAGGGGDGGGAPHAGDGPVKPPPQTPRGAVDYSALASGRWDEG